MRHNPACSWTVKTTSHLRVGVGKAMGWHIKWDSLRIEHLSIFFQLKWQTVSRLLATPSIMTKQVTIISLLDFCPPVLCRKPGSNQNVNHIQLNIRSSKTTMGVFWQSWDEEHYSRRNDFIRNFSIKQIPSQSKSKEECETISSHLSDTQCQHSWGIKAIWWWQTVFGCKWKHVFFFLKGQS